MSELALRDPSAVALQPDRVIQRSGGVWERDIVDGWIQVVEDVGKLASYIAETDFVPKALRNRPAAIAACILTGRELGIGPMQSLKAIHMVQGVPSLSAEYKRARALAAGHDIAIDETNGTRCIVRGKRAGSDRWVTITWTADMARRAKLDGKEVWRAYPQRMLQARASGELCDLMFPDATLGLATTEVLEDGGVVTESGELVDAASGEPASGPAAIDSAKPRTAQRKQRTSPPPAQASAVPQAADSAKPPAGAGGDLPPLPGEEEITAPVPGGDAREAEASKAGSPGPGRPDTTDYDTPGTVSDPQLTAIWTSLSKTFHFGADEKDQARMVCGHILSSKDKKVELTSSKQLSRNQAKAVLDTLAHWKAQAEQQDEDPRGYLMLMLQATRGEEGGNGGE